MFATLEGSGFESLDEESEQGKREGMADNAWRRIKGCNVV